MRKQMLFLAILGLIAAFAVVAQAQTNDILRVNIPYPFMVAGKELPAGDYIIQRTGNTNLVLIIRGENPKTSMQLDVLTRIDGRSEIEPNARIVLDKYDGNHYALSEVFFPGEDGFLLAGAKNAPHKHEVIKGKKAQG
jgi:hypothetical protein